ncbi:hypothetical protein GIB67_041845 [Kingdonia uniflora]|uniref:Leucine-rich repeat-containing N-terminal plant-type domain-containing protein n=1 Tax=Kingdonia uniflora TaxID=39325 RepID=A0A7J7L5W9_9MAGN|nr:hypothetical protein GIB67_041845 [Kingdonia uniflora]
MKFRTLLVLLLCATVLATVNANLEGNALHSWRSNLADPYNVLQSWDPTLINPCTWFHVTCNNDNALIRIDLGAAGLSGILVPELGLLSKLQYMQIGSNNISGSIPKEIGKLRNLVSLGLENNQFSGTIPSSLGHLKSLKFLIVSSQAIEWKSVNRSHSVEGLPASLERELIGNECVEQSTYRNAPELYFHGYNNHPRSKNSCVKLHCLKSSFK